MLPEMIAGPLLWIGQFSIIIQIGLCVHVYKTGRPYWWIWVLLMAPFLGGLLYAFIELLPEARSSGRHAVNLSWFIPKSIAIKRLYVELEEADILETRLSLASLLYEAGRKQEADEVATLAVSGVFKDDPLVISEVSWYKLELGKVEEAAEMISKAQTRGNRAAVPKLALLQARVKYGRFQYGEALETLESLNNLGEEPRYYGALCKLALGDLVKGKEQLEDIIKKYRRGTGVWRRAEKVWFKAAKMKLKELVS